MSERIRVRYAPSPTGYLHIGNARTALFSSINLTLTNPRFLFSTVARLTENHSSIDPSTPLGLTSNDFMSFFNDKIINKNNCKIK